MIAMSSKKEDQHFVPKFYLRNFSYQGNKKQLGIFNIINEKYIQRGKLKTQGYKKHFYGKDGVVEEMLSEIEGYIAPVISSIISSKKPPTKQTSDHYTLLFFLLISIQRNISHERVTNELTDKMYKTVFSKGKFKDEINNYSIGITNASSMGLSFLPEMMMITMDLSYKLLINLTSTPFITSDNPVIKYNSRLEELGARDNITGYGAAGLQMFLPLSNDILILFYDDNFYDVGVTGNQIFKIRNDQVVDDINLLHFVNCEQTIFFNHQVNEEYIRLLFKESKKYQKANVSIVTEHPVMGRGGKLEESSSIIHSRTTSCRTGLSIPFIKATKHAKKFEIGNKAVHIRPAVEKMLNNPLLYANRPKE